MTTPMIDRLDADGDPYTTRVTYLRIHTDGSGDWFVDGAEGTGGYTEECWTYDSHAEAVAALPEFVAALKAAGVVWFDWRAERSTAADRARREFM